MATQKAPQQEMTEGESAPYVLTLFLNSSASLCVDDIVPHNEAQSATLKWLGCQIGGSRKVPPRALVILWKCGSPVARTCCLFNFRTKEQLNRNLGLRKKYKGVLTHIWSGKVEAESESHCNTVITIDCT